MRLLILTMSIFLNAVFLVGCDVEISDNKKVDTEQNMFTKSATENYVIFSPMEGVLMKNGVPLAKTKIIRRLKWNGNDDGLVDEFTTDDQGRFILPIHSETLTLGKLEQFVASTEISVEMAGEIFDVWYNSKLLPEEYAETGAPVEELICDLGIEEIPVFVNESIVPNIMTRCRWKSMPTS